MKTLMRVVIGSWVVVALTGQAGLAAEPQTTPATSALSSQPSASAMLPWKRPIRIPEEIALTHAEPPFAIAGGFSTWRVPFQFSKDMPPGSVLKLQLWGGRNNKGVFTGAQATRPQADGYVSAEADDGSRLTLQPAKQAGTFVLSVPKSGFKKGRNIAVVLGDRTGGGKGIRVSPEHAFNKFFVLYSVTDERAEPKFPQWAGGDVWAKGTDHRIVAACTMHILGGATDHLRVYVPAVTKPGRAFAVLVRPEDVVGNLSHRELRSITVLLDGMPIPAQIETVPGSTCLRATVSLPAAGVHRLTVRDADSGLQAVSNPTRCAETDDLVCWGMIHGHTELSDGTGCIDDYFHQLKDEVLLDFAASSDHDHLFETSDEFWAVTRRAVKRWNKPPEFVAFLGYEWAKWRKNGDGDRNVYYLEDDRPMYRSDDGEHPSPPQLFEALRKTKEKALVIVHHPAHGGNFCDWKDHSPEHERLVEIFQTRGSFECAPEDGNTVPERPGNVTPFAVGYVRNALALGWRVGFTGGGDDHSGHWGTEFRFGPYKQGMMSVETTERSRRAIFEAMHNRRVVATTGSRMLLTYKLNGRPLGSELSLKDDPALASARKLVVEFHGTAPVAQLDIIRNNKVVYSRPGNGQMDLSITWQDAGPIDKTWMPAAKFCNHPFTFYYVRVTQTDGEVAWASPIWIDL
ncbi:MAG: DUF3604 domain-containing protein [Verrucomicrobia bacterium]|nr:DUF3604 domain-containing protein [Verrucomicrobiota bacterium]